MQNLIVSCPYCHEMQELNIRIAIETVQEDRFNGNLVTGRLRAECNHCKRQLLNQYFEE